MSIEFRSPIKMNKKDYIGTTKGNNKKNVYLNMLDKIFGRNLYALQTYSPEMLTALYSNSEKGNPVITTLINKRARLTAEVFNYVKIRDVKTKEIKDTHPALNTLREGNYLEDSTDGLVQNWSINYDLYGESFTYKEKLGVGALATTKLYPMITSEVQVELGSLRNPIKGFTITGITNDLITPKDIMWLRRYNPDFNAKYRGMSPLISAARLIQMLEQGDKTVLNTFANNGTDFLLSPKPTGEFKNVLAKDIEEAEDEFNDPDNKGKTQILRQPFDLLKLGDTPINLGVLETSEYAIKVLCFIYDYPYEMFLGDAKYSNQKEAKKLLYTQIGIPQAKMIAQKLTKFLELDTEGLEFFIDVEDIDALQEDKTAVLNAHSLAMTSINERRAVLGLEPLTGEEYDKPVIPMGIELGYIEPSVDDFNDSVE